MEELIEVPVGLSGVAVTTTEISDVLGAEGYYHYRGRSAPELARTSTFEAVAALVLDGSDEPLVGDRTLPSSLAPLMGRVDLRSALSLVGHALDLAPVIDGPPEQRRSDARRLICLMPTLVASVAHGRLVEPDPDLGHVADYLRMMTGATPAAETVRALEAYFVLTIDHGFSNSAFTTRVVASAGADLGACVVAGFAALSGPRHGANIERILDMFDAIGDPARAEAWLRDEIASRRKLQGFGHSVYRKPDPRLVLLRELGASLAPQRHEMAVAVEEAGTRLLAGRRLEANFDLHAPVVLEACGIARGWFTATFAAARIVGWCAHALEQAAEPKIFRPAAHYVGPAPEPWHA